MSWDSQSGPVWATLCRFPGCAHTRDALTGALAEFLLPEYENLVPLGTTGETPLAGPCTNGRQILKER